MAALSNSQMIKGSTLMIFIDNKSVGFATSHQFSAQTSTSQVQTKDHGNYPAVIPQQTTWTITAENIYSEAGESTYMTAMKNQTIVHVVFAKSNWTAAGIVGTGSTDTWTASTVIAEGDAYITDFSVNAPVGDYATLSVTFTGIGKFTVPSA